MNLLHINASPRAEDSHSLAIAEHFLAELSSKHAITLDRLDLFSANLPEFGTLAAQAKMALFSGRDQTPDEKAIWAEIRAVFDRFAEADTYLFNVPIWNNGMPYKLKHLIDVITQPGWSFGFDPQTGYSGLMTNRRAIIVHSSGVWHETIGENFGSDYSTPVLEDWLRFIGITDIEHIRVQPTVLTDDLPKVTNQAMKQASDLVTQL